MARPEYIYVKKEKIQYAAQLLHLVYRLYTYLDRQIPRTRVVERRIGMVVRETAREAGRQGGRERGRERERERGREGETEGKRSWSGAEARVCGQAVLLCASSLRARWPRMSACVLVCGSKDKDARPVLVHDATECARA
jgi:hypothetical protein